MLYQVLLPSLSTPLRVSRVRKKRTQQLFLELLRKDVTFPGSEPVRRRKTPPSVS